MGNQVAGAMSVTKATTGAKGMGKGIMDDFNEVLGSGPKRSPPDRKELKKGHSQREKECKQKIAESRERRKKTEQMWKKNKKSCRKASKKRK
mmetsp:Transcript_18564/g.25544  ORF Transcript_18564/g.25544 Transcript_18564/m.25544 type:complete len:92 (+) Transcript_18564:88-363(+)